ncbi:uncharacterized protein LOC135495823 [Lineus longissimus]|uniref:uncharacterized protein LOC135495823 n=1 Tax=Lineus longissimus TaxID=88925 RepID=UPI002B4C45B5
MASSGAADGGAMGDGETRKSADSGCDKATLEPVLANTSVRRPPLFKMLEIMRKTKNTVFNIQNSRVVKMLQGSEDTERNLCDIARCLADFNQKQAELLLQLLHLVVFLGQVSRSCIWDWVTAVRGEKLVSKDYNVKKVGLLLGGRFARFFHLTVVKEGLFVNLVKASALGRELEEATRPTPAKENIPSCLKTWSPDQQKALASRFAIALKNKRNLIILACAWNSIVQTRGFRRWLRQNQPTELCEQQFPAVLRYLFDELNLNSREVKIIGQAVVHRQLCVRSSIAESKEEDKAPSKTSTQTDNSQNVQVQSVGPCKVPTSSEISQATGTLNPTVNQSGAQFCAAPTAMASVGGAGARGMTNSHSINQIPTSSVNDLQHSVPGQQLNNMNCNPVNVQKTSKPNRTSSLFLVPPPPLPTPLYLGSHFRPSHQQPVRDGYCNNMVNYVDEKAPPLSEELQVPPAPPAPNMVPDVVLEDTTAGIIASLGCQEDLVNASLIEESLVERMQVGVLADLGVADIHAMPCVRELERKQSTVNELLLSYFAVYPVVTLHDLRHHILKTFDIRDFRQLGLGPFSKQPMLLRYFKTIPALRDILKIQASNVYVHLQSYLQEFYIAELHITPTVSLDRFILYLKAKYGVDDEHRLGIYFRDFLAAQQEFRKVLHDIKFHESARNNALKLRKTHKKATWHAMRNLKFTLFPNIAHKNSRDNDLIMDEKFWDMDAAVLVERVFRKVEVVCAAIEAGRDLLGDLSLTNAPYTSHVLRDFFVHLEEEPWLHELFKLCICVGKSDYNNKMPKLSSLLDSPDGKSCHKSSACPDSSHGLKSMSSEVSDHESPFTMTCYREGQETIMDIIRQCGLEYEGPEDKVETVEAVLLSHFFAQGVRSVEQLGEGGTRYLVDVVEKIQMPANQTSIWYESAVCSNSRVVTYKGNVSNLGLGLLGSIGTEEATSCLLNCPILEDMAEWSSWGLVFEPEFGSLRGFIRDNMTNISALETKPGTLLRIPLTASMDAFTAAIRKKNVSIACGQLVGLVVYHQGDKVTLLDELAEVMLQVLREVNDAEIAEETAKMVDAMLEGEGVEDSIPSESKRGVTHIVHSSLMKLPLLICELVAEKLFLSPLCIVLDLSESKVRDLMSDLSHPIQERNKLCQLGLVLQYEAWYKLFMQRTEKMECPVDGPSLEDDLVDNNDSTIEVQEPENRSLDIRIDGILKGKHASIKLPSEDKMVTYLERKKRDLEHEEGELDDSSAAEISEVDDQEEKDAERLLVDMEQKSLVTVVESDGSQAFETASRPLARAKSTERVIADTIMDPCKAGALFFDDKWKDQSKHTLIMALVAIKHRWSESVNYSLKELRSNVQILTNNGFKSPVKSTIHFGPAFGCKVDFQKTFPGVEWNIVDACYMEDFVPSSSTKSWKDFFQELGVFDWLALRRMNTEKQRDELESGPLSSCMPYLLSYESTKGKQYDYFSINDVICSDIVSLQVDLCKDEYDHMKALYQIFSKDLDVLKQHLTSTLCLCDIVDNMDKIHETDIKVETTFCQYLKILEWIPVKQTNFVQFLKEGAFVGKEELRCAQIKDVYIRIPEIERILAHTVTYLDDDLDPDLAVLLGAKSTLTYHNVLEHFISWCCCDEPESSEAKFITSVQHIKKVYQYFKDHLPPEKLKAFCELPFVFVPDEFCDRDYMKVSGRFYHLNQVCVHDPLYILTNYSSMQESVKLTCLQPLEPHYDEFVSFFMDIAAVESMPRLKDYLTVIETIVGKNDDMKSDTYIMFSIIGDQLSQLQAEELGYVENMLRKFLGPKKMFPTLHDENVSLDDHPYVCYVGEVPESLMRTFSRMSDLHLIKVENLTVSEPCVSMGNTKTFMSVCGIPDICEAITTKLETDDRLRYLDAALKRNIKWQARMIKAFLKKRHPEVADQLTEKKTLLKIHDMKFYKVSKLDLVYGLNDKPNYKHVESLVFHYEKELSAVYVLGEIGPEVNTEINNFLADFLSYGEENVSADIRLFLKDVLPLLEELDLMFIKSVKEGDAPEPTSPHRKRRHKADSGQALKKPKHEPVRSLSEAGKSIENPHKLQVHHTGSYNKQSNVIGGVVGSQGAHISQVEHCAQFGTPSHCYQGRNMFQMNTFRNVNTSTTTGTSPSISQCDINAIGESALKLVTAQLEYKDKSSPLSINSNSLCSRLDKSVEMTPRPTGTSQSDSVIGSDVLNFVKSQMVSKDKDSILTAAIAKSTSSVPAASQTHQTHRIPGASNDVEQDPPNENFLQARQNIQMMIRGQFQNYSGKS